MNDSITLLETLVERIRATAAGYHRGAEEPPAAILWPDPDGAWRPAVAQLQGLMPELLSLGDYVPAQRTGPAIWLKCALAGSLSGVDLPGGVIPVLYLPGVARHQLRAAESCPWEWQPLVELLFRGTVWGHPNGRDWTPEGFLQSAEGLGLDLAGDEKTRTSLRAAIGGLVKTPVDQLRRRGRLEAVDFDEIMVGDTPRDLLTWLASPEGAKRDWGEERWHAFRSRCRDKYDFDPGQDDALVAAEQMGLREDDSWRQLWERYREAPALYPGVREALDRAQPRDILALDPESWPQENEKLENELRAALEVLDQLPPHDARRRLHELDTTHGVRRSWVWAKLDEAPLARSLTPLLELAEATRAIPACSSPGALVAWYVEHGWKADDAARRVRSDLRRQKDEAALHGAIRSVYAPWLEDLNRQFQALVGKHGYESPGGEKAAEGECLLFVDGLRYDVGLELVQRLTKVSLKVAVSHRLAALPTVTPTAKPAVAPIADVCRGAKLPADFRPTGPEGNELTSHLFGKLLEAAGYQRIREDGVTGPASASARGWLETGRIDSRGHDLGAELAPMLAGELERVVNLVEGLLRAGWRSVKIVTDHGWLLLPGGLAKHELPGFLVESRWSRCAAIKGHSTPEVPTVPWRWNSAESVAVAPGSRAFIKGEAYAHGGVSLQECVTPVLRVGGETLASDAVRILAVRWKGLRCAVELSRVEGGLRAGVENAEKRSPITPVKEVEADGQVSLLVADEDQLGAKVIVLITDASGRVIAKAETRVGG
ncbi:MAG: hypothetical protein RIR76_3165 [Verrucomicrobiota bacterium]|jgi:hypothetical protein